MGKITIKAKKLYKIVEENYITKVGGTLTKTAEEINIYATEGIINMYSNTSIDMKAEKEIILGDYQEPPENSLTKHPDIEKVEFVDAEKNSVLGQSIIKGVENGNATPFLYGKKIKIKVTLKEAPKEKLKIELKLKGKSKNTNQKFVGIDKFQWSLNIENKILETNPFTIPLDWYNEDFEKYNYDTHKTTIDTNNLNSFSLDIFYNGKIAFLPKRDNHLKPIAYRRNYEELIGLFKTDNSGDKDSSNNYENKFIKGNSEISTLVKEFLEFIQIEDLTTQKIKNRVKTDSKKLWDLAVKQVQNGNLDDRPLYWARNKIQVRLKRYCLFEDQINFEESIVKKGTELEEIITLFEEKSRNYTGIDFSKAPVGSKKVLITGFDPFILNEFDNNYLKSVTNPNILQSNPSGVVALALANNNNLGANIQTMIVPVRYTDFDQSQDHDKGQGTGIIEKYIKPFINKVDMIITISQAGEGDYNIDKYATATRGGFNDNQDFKRITGSQALITTDEWIETTLPKEMTKAPLVKYNWNYDGKNGQVTPPKIGQKISYGPGGAYLSNEIFYRVAKLRKDNKPKLKTGHFHISKIQGKGQDIEKTGVSKLVSIVKKGIEEGIKNI
ncbi:hypothetical protein [Tenacibaculum maritimum]|uniref:hypothetical protein n=1 Tax=Tenacibaculum maritimum TaxID=107401 RepID=UPI001E57558E|nr:hypothetical protein [Tenacibaculum maritimum]MCD9582106.1 hypothetical protein [Tenacibaculum maritimum]MCD9635343.1 hypothetical protein [Tenacibaculum maritimum]